MAIWGCASPAGCCQPAVAGGVIYAHLWGELSTDWPPRRLCLLRVLLGAMPPLQVFPFPSTLREVTLHQLSQAGLLGGAAAPAFPGQLVRDSPAPPPRLRCSESPPPSLLHVFFVVIAYYSVSVFSLGGGRSVQGAILIWPKFVCGSTMYRLAHGHLPKPSGHRHLAAAREPSWFLHLTWSGDAVHRLEVWRSQSFVCSGWFFL
jgi:hypothetical protein